MLSRSSDVVGRTCGERFRTCSVEDTHWHRLLNDAGTSSSCPEILHTRGAFNEGGQREAGNDAVRKGGVWVVVQRLQKRCGRCEIEDPWLAGNDAQPRK